MSAPEIAFRAVDLFPPVDIGVDTRPDGTVHLLSNTPRVPFPPTLAQALADRAAALGDQPLLVARDAEGRWVELSYRQAKERADRIAGWLRDRGRPDERILILTGNSAAQAQLCFGAAAAGVPVCPVSVQYSQPGGEYSRLAHVVSVVRPTIVFAERVGPILQAMRQVVPPEATVICGDPESWPGAVDWQDVLGHQPPPDADAWIAALDPDTPVRYMLTSGSTGRPKAVVQTHRMWCSLFSGVTPILSQASGWRVRTLDWMPWSHVSGISVLIGSLLNGGTFYLDDGRPTPALFGRTLRNLAEVQPLFFANVPFAFAMLCDALEADPVLREKFFAHLQLCLYGGAGLPQPVYDRFQAMSEQTIGKRIMFTTGYGCTEATAGVMTVYWPTTEVGVGLPVPGVEVKLAPLDETRYEARFRGDCVMAGYLDHPEATARAFDEEGFYRTGDAVSFVDPADPLRGMVFAGRLAEEFKLTTGTFVRGGEVRAQVVAAASPVVSDLVVCGEGYDEVGVLLWLNPAGCAAVLDRPDADPEDPAILDWLAEQLRPLSAGGSASGVARLAVLDSPPDLAAGEVSDKGSINQSLARIRRAADLRRLYAGGPGVRVLG